MKYHDYHLKGYSVSDFGNTISLDLIFDYPNSPKVESRIIFSDVAAHNFIHTGGAIITDILQTKLTEISKELDDGLIEWARKYGGLIHYDGDLETCKAKLDKDGYKAWTICSAIGFSGLVIAKDVK
ncbi:MAG: uncharacterized protein JWQ04_310 [Pedosphaera sp.]|nr:uncharacterized protein [Pedosphaera sp.]